ncbi:MAG TPA: hypothetical protein VLB09_07350, partial [Nitrospiria bacterium]|nr:hypothetical protein [Nitrospiria bacterium]
GKYCHLGSDTLMKKISGIQNAYLTSIDRYDNDVGGSHRIGYDQEASSRSQYGLPEDVCRKHEHQKKKACADGGFSSHVPPQRRG